MANLLNAGRLFQTLLDADKPPGATVAADLDVDSIDDLPFITHSALFSHAGNGLWDVNLSVSIFIDPRGAFPVVADVYRAIHAWGENPLAGIVPGVGAVESVEDMNAFAATGGDAVMTNKIVRHYLGSFNIQATYR